ncbi:endolytic transglycosylase MltG [Nocardia rosealba]|uniref:endolytic transglycosylase MltG n=1 Tax=Nocardia rosealba TaxID=2878563 RepID=UPI001CD9D97A|nr:endolytic transglycosylase MltG [Nocardia rosealba]MCA2208483.1 endolytic transglycosylase MltG [Nocardia rosealba]
MTDRWARAEERYRAREADRRYPRRDDWGLDPRASREEPEVPEWDDFDDDTNVIPRYEDEFPEPEPEPEPEPPRRVGQRPPRATPAGRGRGRSGAGRGKRSRIASRKAAERKRRRRNMWVVAAVFALLFVSAAGFAGYKLMGSLAPAEDFAGPAGKPVVVQVHPGDTATEIADAMHERGIVASSEAFYEAAVQNAGMNSVQPGFYAIGERSPAADAVAALVGGKSRVGNVVVSEGRLLHDKHDVSTGGRYDGIYRKIADASCVGPERKCVTYEQLDAAGASLDLAALGVPQWAMQAVKDCPDRARQLEGLIAAGTWDFDPSGTPQQILKQLITASVQAYEATGLLQSGADTKLSPYETLIAASLVEREAKPEDMGKVARVIVNRLQVGQMLQFDSTVNYTLDTTEVATTDADRAAVTAWNTYAMEGLPKTPIAAPSVAALQAMEKPEPGPWLYFVTVDKQGTTKFTDSYQEHLRLVTQAQRSGILDSSRTGG